jgi:hypothetical protein
LISGELAGSATADRTSRRFRERDFEVRMWRANAWWRLIFPVPVFLNRLAAPLWVFNFGIEISWVAGFWREPTFHSLTQAGVFRSRDLGRSLLYRWFPGADRTDGAVHLFSLTCAGNPIAEQSGMPRHERVRDFMTAPPSGEYFREKANEGWRLVAVEWERGPAAKREPMEDVPFGTRVASDCKRLEDDPDELQVLLLMMETIAQDGPLSQAAGNINERGYRTRDGEKWTPLALFYLLPRLIEVGPRLCTSEEWVERRKHLFNVA